MLKLSDIFKRCECYKANCGGVIINSDKDTYLFDTNKNRWFIRALWGSHPSRRSKIPSGFRKQVTLENVIDSLSPDAQEVMLFNLDLFNGEEPKKILKELGYE